MQLRLVLLIAGLIFIQGCSKTQDKLVTDTEVLSHEVVDLAVTNSNYISDEDYIALLDDVINKLKDIREIETESI